MDKEYLERGALIDYLEKRMEKYPVFLGVVCPRIADFPKADVVEVKHGRWIPFLDGDFIEPERYYRCSKCGRVEEQREPYCHCGAKMDGG